MGIKCNCSTILAESGLNGLEIGFKNFKNGNINCYKCGRSAIISARENSCRECFLKVFSKNFRSNLRTKCLEEKDSNRILAILFKDGFVSTSLLHLILDRNNDRHLKDNNKDNGGGIKVVASNSDNKNNKEKEYDFSFRKLVDSDDLKLRYLVNVENPLEEVEEVENRNWYNNTNEQFRVVKSVFEKYTNKYKCEMNCESSFIVEYMINNVKLVNMRSCYFLHNKNFKKSCSNSNNKDNNGGSSSNSSDGNDTDEDEFTGVMNTNDKCDVKCREFITKCKKLFKEDPDFGFHIWTTIRLINIREYFRMKNEDRMYLVMPETQDDICKKALYLTCIGLGGEVNNRCSFVDRDIFEEFRIKILRPLKTFTLKEIAFYNKFNELENISRSNSQFNFGTNSSIFGCISFFTDELNLQHSNTFHNITNITNRLVNNPNRLIDENIKGCSICRVPSNLNRGINSQGVILQSNEVSLECIEQRNILDVMAFNKCKQWNGEFNDVFGIDVEHIGNNDYEKLIDIICVWEVLRLISKSDVNVENTIKFISSFKVVSGNVGREFDECVERGINRANILFSDLIKISSVLKGFYLPNSTIMNFGVNNNNNKVMDEIYRNKKCYVKNPGLFKINKPLKNNLTISTNNTNNNKEINLELQLNNSNQLNQMNKINNNNLDKRVNNRTRLQYISRSIPFILIKNYMILQLLNEGSVGRVYLAIDYKRNLYAVKMIHKSEDDYRSFNKIKDELIIASKLKHENIVETYIIMESKKNLLLFMEYCSGGDLITFIRKNGNLSENMVKGSFKMLINSIKFLHDNNIYHRDIKPENIFLVPMSSVLLHNKTNSNIGNQSSRGNNSSNSGINNGTNNINSNIRDTKYIGNIINKNNINKNDLTNYVLKLGDFGASVRNKKEVKLFETVGTMSYAAPEVLEGVSGYYGEKADIWSLGVVLYAMIFGQLPYITKEDTVSAVLNKILNTKLTFPNVKSSKEVKDLISKMLEINSYKRITLKQILKHEWLIEKGNKINESENIRKENEEMRCSVREADNRLSVIVDEMI